MFKFILIFIGLSSGFSYGNGLEMAASSKYENQSLTSNRPAFHDEYTTAERSRAVNYCTNEYTPRSHSWFSCVLGVNNYAMHRWGHNQRPSNVREICLGYDDGAYDKWAFRDGCNNARNFD